MYCCCCCFSCDEKQICNCCSFFTQKVFQIMYLIGIILILIFLTATLSIINWGKIPGINLTLFLIILFIILTCLILGIMLYSYTNSTLITEEVKRKINIITTMGFIISIVVIVICVIEEILLSLSFSQARENYPCNTERNSKSIVSVGFFFF